jgi:hypothetical protein
MTTASVPRSHVQVSTAQYEFAHGRKPRGTGDWAFFFDGDRAPFWVVGVSFTEARKHAVTVAAERGVSRVEVGS